MTKYFFNLCFLFLCFHIFSQDLESMKTIAKFSTDAELTSYINKAKSNGLSLIQIEELVTAQGASADELSKLRTLWNANALESSSVDVFLDEAITSFGETEITENSEIKPNETRRFGSNFFENKNISEVPQLFIATPLDYRLGPGDELMINLYGASDNSYSVQISRNGTVKFDRLAPIYLSGLSIKSAKTRLKNRLSKLYSGLASNDQLIKVDIDVSLQKARSVVINITGQVVAPGTYTISGFSSVLNALYAAGGPNEVGSYRNIKLLRKGKVSEIIDLYDYFVKGVYPNVYLRDQDVLLVEAYDKQVNVGLGLKTNALYDLKENETVEDILNFAGGFSSNSYKEKIFVSRINSYSRSIVEIFKNDFPNSIMIDGDVINAKPISDLIENSVSINGSVYLPGTFDLSSVKTVKDLLNSSNGLNPNAINKGFLYRTEKGIEDEIVSLDFSNNNDLSIVLKDQDKVVVLSREDIYESKTVKSMGELINPSSYDLKNGMKVSDLILLSGGFTNNADYSRIILLRDNSANNSKNLIQKFELVFDENYNSENDLLMKNNDLLIVSKIPFKRQMNSFTISGAVSLPGSYVVEKENYSVEEALKNVKFLKNSNTDQIHILRDGIRVPIKTSEFNSFKIFNGDNIVVPELDDTVRITGAVQQESIVDYKLNRSFKKLIYSSGGFSENADRLRSYVIYPNGLKKQTRNFVLFKSYPKVIPGSVIVVPEKIERESKVLSQITQITTITSSIASLLAIVKLIE